MPTPPTYKTAVQLNPYSATIVQFGATSVHSSKVSAQLHLHRLNTDRECARSALFGKVCESLHNVKQVLVVGGHTSLADFRHYVEKLRPHTAPQVVGYLVVDHPSEPELLALARAWFIHHEQMAGIAA